MRRIGYCKWCKAVAGEDMLIVTVNNSPLNRGCSCWFRKKLDFKKLCNVDEIIKIKEDA